MSLHQINSQEDLTRHMASRHREGISSAVVYKCPLSNCTYSGEGFLRKDNCNRHIRNEHSLLSFPPILSAHTTTSTIHQPIANYPISRHPLPTKETLNQQEEFERQREI